MPGSDKEGNDDQPRVGELISLRQAAKLSGLSHSHLSLQIRKGEIWGKKIGSYWVTTAKAVREYLARDRRTGPKSK